MDQEFEERMRARVALIQLSMRRDLGDYSELGDFNPNRIRFSYGDRDPFLDISIDSMRRSMGATRVMPDWALRAAKRDESIFIRIAVQFATQPPDRDIEPLPSRFAQPSSSWIHFGLDASVVETL